MKNFVRLAVAGAIAAGYSVGAFAQLGPAVPNAPSSAPADLWVFVADPAANDTFAVDTGISLNSLQPGSYTSGAKLANDTNGGFSVTSAALASFVASSADPSALTYGLLGAQFQQEIPQSPASQTAGQDLATFSAATTTAASKVTGMTFANLATVNTGFNDNVNYLLSTYTQGGTVYSYAAGSSTGQVWGGSSGLLAGSTSLYGQGPTQAGVNLGTATNLYDLTGNNNSGDAQSYLLGTLTVSANGTITNIAPAPVPLPAAVWLLGSGLLGLFGVGRRRAA